MIIWALSQWVRGRIGTQTTHYGPVDSGKSSNNGGDYPGKGQNKKLSRNKSMGWGHWLS